MDRMQDDLMNANVRLRGENDALTQRIDRLSNTLRTVIAAITALAIFCGGMIITACAIFNECDRQIQREHTHHIDQEFIKAQLKAVIEAIDFSLGGAKPIAEGAKTLLRYSGAGWELSDDGETWHVVELQKLPLPFRGSVPSLSPTPPLGAL